MSGNWNTQNAILPGVYTNFNTIRPLSITVGDRGIVALASNLKWGVGDEFIYVNRDNCLEQLGYAITSDEMFYINEILLNATEVLVYKLSTGEKATGTINTNLTVTAKYEGVRGNDISVVVAADGSNFIIKTLVDGEVLDTQEVSSVAGFVANDWITIAGEGTLKATTVTLSGGTTTAGTETQYNAMLGKLNSIEFNVFTYDHEPSTAIRSATIAKVKQLRNEFGQKVQAVLPTGAEESGADYEGIISPRNGYKVGSKVVSYVYACPWLAGAQAGAYINDSLTYKAVDSATDVDVRLTKKEQETAVNAGLFTFVNKGDKVVCLYDINTLTSFTNSNGVMFRKNRVVRTIDNINNDIVTIFESNYIGKTDNNNNGRNLLKGAICDYLGTLENINAIQNFDPATDIEVLPGVDTDAVVINLWIQPVDSIEKIYIQVNLV